MLTESTRVRFLFTQSCRHCCVDQPRPNPSMRTTQEGSGPKATRMALPAWHESWRKKRSAPPGCKLLATRLARATAVRCVVVLVFLAPPPLDRNIAITSIAESGRAGRARGPCVPGAGPARRQGHQQDRLRDEEVPGEEGLHGGERAAGAAAAAAAAAAAVPLSCPVWFFARCFCC